MNKDKPGYKTTEFWAMIIAAIFGIMLVTEIISIKDTSTIMLYTKNIMGGVITAASVVSYIFSRGKVKSNNVNYTQLLKDIEKIVNKA